MVAPGLPLSFPPPREQNGLDSNHTCFPWPRARRPATPSSCARAGKARGCGVAASWRLLRHRHQALEGCRGHGDYASSTPARAECMRADCMLMRSASEAGGFVHVAVAVQRSRPCQRTIDDAACARNAIVILVQNRRLSDSPSVAETCESNAQDGSWCDDRRTSLREPDRARC